MARRPAAKILVTQVTDPTQYGVNAACIEGMSPFDFREVPVLNGRTHPRDRADAKALLAGWLRFEPNDPA